MSLQLYKNKYHLEFKPNTHKYLINGLEKPGVTSILSILNKPGLPQWAANQAVEWIRSNSLSPPSKTKTFLVTENDLRQARIAFNQKRDNSADVGKQVHAWIEEHIKNKIDKVDRPDDQVSEDMKPSVESFLKWEAVHQPEYIFSERTIYSEAEDYCGTCDVGLVLKDSDGNPKRVILDFKTGKPEKEYDRKLRRYTGRKRPYNTVFVQDALYDLAIEEEDGIRADKYGALYLSTDGEILFGLTDDTDAFREAGTSIVRLYKAMKQIDFKNKWINT